MRPKSSLRLVLSITSLAYGILFTNAVVASRNRTPREKISRTKWHEVRGANFIPSYASNTYEIWHDYKHDIFDRELGLVEAVGYNSIRLWLNYSAFEVLGSRMVDRVEDALRLCAKHHLRAVVVLFDSCGVRPRKDAKWMTTSEAYELFQSSPRFSAAQKQWMEKVFAKYAKGFGAKTLVPVGSDSPMMTLVWQNWQPSPGNDRLGAAWYPRLESYVDSLLSRLKGDRNVLLWDLMNEPEFASEGPVTPDLLITPEMQQLRDAFLRHFQGFIQGRYPNEIVGIGWAALENCEKYADMVDVLTFHVYRGPEDLGRIIDQAYTFSQRAGKPILITETLANWDFGSPEFGRLASDEAQLAHYQKVLPVLLKSPIGWIAWGMVISRDFDPFCDIFYPDGHPRPAAVYLENSLKGRTKAQ